MTTPGNVAGDILGNATRDYYGYWAETARNTPGHPPPPSWDSLDSEQRQAWMLVCASNLELSARLSTAILLTVEDA